MSTLFLPQVGFSMAIWGSVVLLFFFLLGIFSPKMTLLIAIIIWVSGGIYQSLQPEGALPLAQNSSNGMNNAGPFSPVLSIPAKAADSLQGKQKQKNPEFPKAEFPPLNPHLTLHIEGVSDKEFIEELEKHMGYKLGRKGDFKIEVMFTGILGDTINRQSGKMEFSYSGGSVILNIDGMPCIGVGNLVLAKTEYQGWSLQEVNRDLEQRKILILKQNVRQVAQSLRQCLP